MGREQDESWEITQCHCAVFVQMWATIAYLYATGREKKKRIRWSRKVSKERQKVLGLLQRTLGDSLADWLTLESSADWIAMRGRKWKRRRVQDVYMQIHRVSEEVAVLFWVFLVCRMNKKKRPLGSVRQKAVLKSWCQTVGEQTDWGIK